MTAIASPPSNSEVAVTGAPVEQLAALLEGAGVAHLGGLGWIRVTGADRVRWLNGMTTNSIQELKPGEGNYNFFLSSQGRIQGDAYAFVLEDSILLETAADRIPALIELLDRFIIMDDVELHPQPDMHGLVVAGPNAAALLQRIGASVKFSSQPHLTVIIWTDQEPVTVIHAHSPLVPRFELWSDSETLKSVSEALIAAGAASVSVEALNYLRILEGTPLYGTDIRDRELPQETAQTHALHFAKGCYLGQEIVERIRSRGNVHRTFHAFQLTGDLPPAGAILEADGKAVGELTSVTTVPLASGPVRFALGYVRRETLERNLTITYPGGTALPALTPFSAT